MGRKSSPPTSRYRPGTSQNAGTLASFREQMADYVRGEMLRELREQRHESQWDVASAVKVTEKAYRAWEHGGKIKWPNAQKLGKHLGIEPELLVSRDGGDPSDEELLTPFGEILKRLDHIEQMLEQLLNPPDLGAEDMQPVKDTARPDLPGGEPIGGVPRRPRGKPARHRTRMKS